ncbi:hypothetical protein [Chitinophaga sp. CF418]|uniref:hypothetical protein n=1 Tax=Chitinophaga sp. CF418 TaxID=1855287 RepID=UPI00091E4BFB|nr:hypothetical protein [Chitinophaga sp. CF418]SHM86327.1 hypothetical protein SAMN05216311_103503 [Chitinophaga sp. CF418]
MKTTLFVVTAFLFSGAVFAQKATVKTNQSATIGTNSVNGTASAQTVSQADIKPDNVKTGTNGAANASTGITTKNSTAVASEGKANISAATEHADALKNSVNSTSSATVKSTQNISAAAGSEIKQTAVGTKATVKSVDAGVKNHTKVAASSSVKAVGAVHNNLKAPSIKPAAHIGANMKVGLR